jgi:hypothetical protein
VEFCPAEPAKRASSGAAKPRSTAVVGGSVRSGKKNDLLSRLKATDDGGRGLRSGGHLRGA